MTASSVRTWALFLLIVLLLIAAKDSLWPATKVRVDNLTADDLQEAIDTGELFRGITDEFCKTIEVPATDEVFYTLWRAPAALTVDAIWCEILNGTSVTFDWEVDAGGTPAGVCNVADTGCICNTGGMEFTSFLGGDTMAAGNRLDLDLGAVVGEVDSFSVCLQFTYD